MYDKNQNSDKHFMSKYLTIICLLSALLTACTRQQPLHPALVQADSLMYIHPDSALDLLQQINIDELHGQANHAYYALLLTQAKDKNYIWAENDSLIRVAARYYDSTDDIAMRARTHYLWGSSYRDINDYGQAVKEYLTAMPLAEKAGNKRLQMALCNNAGFIYYTQALNEKADSLYRIAEKLAIDLNDTICRAESLLQQGMIDINRGKAFYPESEKKMLQAYRLSKNIENKVLKKELAYALSTLYSYMGNGKEALRFTYEHRSLSTDSLKLINASLLGEAFYQAGQYDSATIYLKQALSLKGYNTLSGIYMRLADIAKEQGDLATSVEMERIYSAYKDSISLLNQTNKMIEAEKGLQLRQQLEAKQRAVTFKYIVYISIISTILIFAMIYLYRRHCKRTARLQQEKEAIIKQKQTLVEESSSLKEALQKEKTEKSALQKEAFNYSEVYEKIERIIENCKDHEFSSEELTDDDWLTILAEANRRCDNITLRLGVRYPSLSKNDIHLCCLTLLDIPKKYIGYLMKCSRSACYKREDNILEKKMGYTHKTTTLKKILTAFA